MLTDRQQEVLDFLREFIDVKGYPPTIREIGQHFRIGHNAAYGHLLSLRRKGFVDWQPAESRTLVCKRPSTSAASDPV
jgi:repressor LexA